MPFSKGPGTEVRVPPATGLRPGGVPPAEPHAPPAPSKGWSCRTATDPVPLPQRCRAGAPGSPLWGQQPPPSTLCTLRVALWLCTCMHTRAHTCTRMHSHTSLPAPLPAAHPLLSSSISTAVLAVPAHRPWQVVIVALPWRLIKVTVRGGTPWQGEGNGSCPSHAWREEAGAQVHSATLIAVLSSMARVALEPFLAITLMALPCLYSLSNW